MIGVVVWSCASREKAIIWCEDQANLAYLDGAESLAQPIAWPEAGDLVEMETRTQDNLRQAYGLTMLSEKGCPDLPQLLSETEARPHRPQHLRVVASQPDPRDRPAPKSRPRQAPFAWPRSGAAC